ncbi:MAG: hypothetical protein IPL60_03725 [Ardenticatenia bacterium]|nr:hypothetical protein [Ardenticatenia bacterium]
MTVNAHARRVAIIVMWSSMVVALCSCASFDSRPNGTIIPIDGYVGTWRLVTGEGDLEIEIENNNGSGTLSYSAQSADPTRNMTATHTIELQQIHNVTIAILGDEYDHNEIYRLEMLDEHNIRAHKINNDTVRKYVTEGVFVEEPPDNMFGFEGVMGTIVGTPAEIAEFVQKPDAFDEEYTELERVNTPVNDTSLRQSEPARIVYILGGAVLVAMCAGYMMTRRPGVT